MRFSTTIEQLELDKFISGHRYGHYLQTGVNASIKRNNNEKVHTFTMLDGYEIVATGMFTMKYQKLTFSTFNCERGIVIDYNNRELLDEYFKGLKKYCKELGVVSVNFNPIISASNKEALSNLSSLGIISSNKLDDLYVLDLDDFDLSDNLIDKLNDYDYLTVTTSDYSSFKDLYKLQAIKEQGISASHISLDNTEKLFHEFNQKHRCDLYIVQVELYSLVNAISKYIDVINEEISKTDDEEKISIYKNYLVKLNANLVTYKEYNKMFRDKIIIAAALVFKIGTTLYVVNDGKEDLLSELNPLEQLFKTIINDTKGTKFTHIVFNSSPIGDSNNEKYIELYKEFGCTENKIPSSFTYVANPMMYKFVVK